MERNALVVRGDERFILSIETPFQTACQPAHEKERGDAGARGAAEGERLDLAQMRKGGGVVKLACECKAPCVEARPIQIAKHGCTFSR